MKALPGDEKWYLYVDNAFGHKCTEVVRAALFKINIVLQFFPKNATDLCQPADSFIIQRIKTVWRRKWGEKKLDMISKEQWVDWKAGSGKLTSPRKKFYLKLAAEVFREVEKERDRNGVCPTLERL